MSSILVAQKGSVNQTANRLRALRVQIVLRIDGESEKYDDGPQILQNLRFRLIDSSEERFDAIGLVRSIGDRRPLELLP